MRDGRNTFLLALADMMNVQGLLALLTTAALSYMVGVHTDIPQWYTATWGIIIGYYFSGIQSRKQNQNNQNESE